MIFNPTPSGIQPADAFADLSAANRRGDLFPGQGARAEAPREVDLNSQGSWSELIRDIVKIANSGGGRVEVRCVGRDESATSVGRLFSAQIESTSGAMVTESAPGPKKASTNLQPVRIV